MARRRRVNDKVQKRLNLTLIQAEINEEPQEFISLRPIYSTKDAWMYVIGELDMEEELSVAIMGYTEIDGLYELDVKTFYEHAKRVDVPEAAETEEEGYADTDSVVME